MKKILLIVIILIVGCSKPINDDTLISKDGLKYIPYTKELYSGKVFKNYMGGKKQFEGIYMDGEKYGLWKYYTEDGKILSEISFPVTDIDGNSYKIEMIGKQIWIVENLKVTHYRNGNPIPNLSRQDDWNDTKLGAYCNYDNDESNVETYGRLYNWFSVNDKRGLVPKGWHIPTDEEWDKLVDYLGGDEIAGRKLKSIGTRSRWNKFRG